MVFGSLSRSAAWLLLWSVTISAAARSAPPGREGDVRAPTAAEGLGARTSDTTEGTTTSIEGFGPHPDIATRSNEDADANVSAVRGSENDQDGERPPSPQRSSTPARSAGQTQEAASLPVWEVPDLVVEGEGAPPTRPEQVQVRAPTAAVSVVDVESRSGVTPDTTALLSGVPGVHLQQLGGFGQAQSLSLRGASSSGVLVLLDGIPLNGAGGLTDLSLLPVAWLSRIEVLRGGGGAAYGSGALGGAVNLVTRDLPGEPAAELQLGAGSFGAFNGSASLSGSVLGTEALLLVHGFTSQGDFPYLHDDTPGHEDPLQERRRGNNDAHLAGGMLRVQRDLGAAWALSALGELTFDARGIAGPALNPSPERREAHRRATAALRLSREPNEGPKLSARAWVRTDDAVLEGPGLGVGAQAFQTAALEFEASHSLHPAHLLALEVGVGGERYRAEFSQQRPQRIRAHVSLRDRWVPWSPLALVPAVRLEQVGHQALLSPGLGAELRLGRHWLLKGNAGQSHRAPSFLELYVMQAGLAPNPTLLPERALSADLGLGFEAPGLEATLTGYYGLYENLIAYEFYPPSLPRPYNFATADAGGTELTLQAEPWPWLLAEGSWTWMRTRNLRDDLRYFGKALPYRPEHRGTVRLEGGPDWLRAHAELEAQSAQFASRDHRTTLPPRAFVHTGLTWRTGPKASPLRLALECRNLTDARVHDLSGYPLPPRSFHLSLRARTGG